MKILTFLFINFIVSFVSDIVLNDLSHMKSNHSFQSLKPYFNKKYITEAGIYAGLTIVVAVSLVMILSKFLLGFYNPKKAKELMKFIILAYLSGYIIDIIIEKLKIFDGLDRFYTEIGSGHSGAIAFIFSILFSYLIQNKIVPLL